MPEIPATFNQPDAAFVLIRDGQKYPPIRDGWQKPENAHTFAQAQAHKGNVGILAGNGYIGLDKDDPSAFYGLPLPTTTTWETRPGRLGLWFKCSDLTPELLAKYGKKSDLAQFKLYKDGLPVGEVKLQRSYQTIPPSWKKLEDGTRADYKLLDSSPPAEISLLKLLADLQALGITFSSKLEANAAKLEDMGKKARQKHAESDEVRTRRYGEAALRDEVLTLAGSPVGSRNEQLNRSAFVLAQFVAAKVLSENEIVSALTKAAENTGLELEEIRATIASGLEAGSKHPRQIPEPTAAEVQDDPSPEHTIGIGFDEITVLTDKGKPKISATKAASAVLGKMPLAMAEDSEDIYRFTGQIYKPDGARIIDSTLCAVAGDLFNNYQKRETLRRITNKLLDNPVVFEPNPYLLGAKNGVADLLTGEVREYRPEDFILDQIPVSYDASAKCPAFLAFLESITPNVSDRITLIDWFAATAIKEPFAYVLFLLGLGRNGKGIYEKLIKKFFGKTAFRDMPLAEVGKNNFAAGGFYRKRGWIASETGRKKASIGTDFIKLTSGNGSIDGDRKNQSRIQFEPYFQTIVDTNTMPKIEDSSIGWQERFVKVDLHYFFVANPDDANPLEKQRDPALFDKLSTPSELSGILNLLLFRSKAIGRSKAIHKRAGSEMFAEYADQSSSVTSFLDTFCEFEDKGLEFWTLLEPIYDYYKKWCSYKVGEVVDIRYFGKQLKNFCGGLEPKRGKDKDRRSTRSYKYLNFDSNKCKEAIEALQLSMSPNVSECIHVSPYCIHVEKEEKSQKITMSPLSPCNLWSEILRRFGELPQENISKSSTREEKAKIDGDMDMMETSASSEVVAGEPNGYKMGTSTETTPIEADQLGADRVEHFIELAAKRTGKSLLICAKCGEDLTGHGVVEKGGKSYCARPGCGYPAR